METEAAFMTWLYELLIQQPQTGTLILMPPNTLVVAPTGIENPAFFLRVETGFAELGNPA